MILLEGAYNDFIGEDSIITLLERTLLEKVSITTLLEGCP
jgi:hypothetical protein